MIEIYEQQQVLLCQNKNMAVAASAGSGKTTVMISKIMDVLTSPDPKIFCDIKNLLVLTYTNSTASELSFKIEKKLLEAAQTNAAAQAQISSMSLAHIGTFHGYCQKIIKKYGYLIDFCCDFQLCDQAKQNSLQNMAFEKLCGDLYENNPSQMDLFSQYFGEDFSVAKLKSIIFSINEFLQNWPKSFLAAKKQCLDFYDCNKLCMQFAENAKSDFLRLFLHEKQLISDIMLTCDDQKLLAHLLQFQNESELLCQTKDFQTFVKVFGAQNAKSRMPQKTNLSAQQKELIKQAKSMHSKTLSNYSKVFLQFDFEQFKQQCAMSKNIFSALFDLCKQFEQNYSALKTQEGLLDFSDLEKTALKILSNPTAANEIKNSTRYIFVDEFQDANYVQKELLDKISSKNNLFLVGDIKQSIYQFRQSCPEIFAKLLPKFKRDKNSECFFLNCNFRSKPEILNFANSVFEKIIFSDMFDVDYKNQSMFMPYAKFEKVEGEIPVNFLAVDEREKKPETGCVPQMPYSIKQHYESAKIMQSSPYQKLASAVAQKIVDLQQEQIYDLETKQKRKIQLKDICILLKKRTHLEELCKALNDCGISYIASGNNKLGDYIEIMQLANLVKISYCQTDDIALASVLLSPICGLDEAELFEVANHKNMQTSLFEKAKSFCSQFASHPTSLKLGKLFDAINLLNWGAQTSQLDKCLQQIINNCGFVEAHTLCNNPNCLARIEQFLSLISQKSMFESFDFVENQLENVLEAGIAQEEDCVSITTMHSSKGLEWPIVFLFDCSSSLDKRGGFEGSKIKLLSNLGGALKSCNQPDIAWSVAQNRQKMQERAEDYRLLYVATTRAKNKLIVCGILKENVFSCGERADLFYYDNYFQTLLSTLSSAACNQISNHSGSKTLMLFDDVSFDFAQINNSQQALSPDKTTGANVDVANKILAVSNKLENTEKHFEKFSVTQLQNQESKLLHTNKTLGHDQTTSNHAEIGTAFHKIMQLADFNNPHCVQKILQDLCIEQDVFSTITQSDVLQIEKNLSALSQITKGRKLFKEQQFVMKSDGAIVQGALDLLAEGDDDVVIVDYKYSNKKPQDLAVYYKKQLMLYAEAATKAFLKPLKSLIIFNIKTGKMIDLLQHPYDVTAPR